MRCPSCQRDSIEIIADYWAHFATTHRFAKWEKNPPHQQQPFAAEAPAQHGHLDQVATRRVRMGCFLGYKVGPKTSNYPPGHDHVSYVWKRKRKSSGPSYLLMGVCDRSLEGIS